MRLRALRTLIVTLTLLATPLVGQAAAVGAAPLDDAGVVSNQPLGDQVANLAVAYVGTPYTWGGISPAGFDCTGFVLWVFAQFGQTLPHSEAGQLASGQPVGLDALRPGDVLVFANTYRAGLSHTGIYLGEGQFVHAADERHGVVVSAVWDGYWGPRLVAASRPLA